jgi:hypothetical protein
MPNNLKLHGSSKTNVYTSLASEILTEVSTEGRKDGGKENKLGKKEK